MVNDLDLFIIEITKIRDNLHLFNWAGVLINQITNKVNELFIIPSYYSSRTIFWGWFSWLSKINQEVINKILLSWFTLLTFNILICWLWYWIFNLIYDRNILPYKLLWLKSIKVKNFCDLILWCLNIFWVVIEYNLLILNILW